MPRKTSLTHPLLYVVQPEFQERKSKVMQTRYHAKIGKEKQEVSSQEDDRITQSSADSEQKSASMKNEHKDLVEQVVAEVEPLQEEKTEKAIKDQEQEDGSKLKNKELMQFFLQRLNSEVQKSEKEPSTAKDQTQEMNNHDQEPVQNSTAPTEKPKNLSGNEEVKRLISRLSRYPDFIEKPLCEAVVRGKRIRLQVDKKRGEQVRVIIDSRKEVININEISELNIL